MLFDSSIDKQPGNPAAVGGLIRAYVSSGELALARQIATGVTPELAAKAEVAAALRSEEHTSELQSRRNLVCRLLLEKKN